MAVNSAQYIPNRTIGYKLQRPPKALKVLGYHSVIVHALLFSNPIADPALAYTASPSLIWKLVSKVWMQNFQ